MKNITLNKQSNTVSIQKETKERVDVYRKKLEKTLGVKIPFSIAISALVNKALKDYEDV